jgi:2-polyprenyl-3-methyl-5-hydroxy-6-metoxy-1,4-benzoquinol methylase
MAFNTSYLGLRSDLLSLVETGASDVLDVGCATGENGRYLEERKGCRVTGVELDPAMAEEASRKISKVVVADLNERALRDVIADASFDVILLGDVIEHLVDPWSTLADAKGVLREGGRIVISVPNVCHYSTILSLIVLRRWPYRDRGIHDRSHLRFFTRKNLLEMYRSCGLEIERELRNLRIVERISKANRVAMIFDFPPFRTYFTFQYLHRLRPENRDEAR